MAWSRGRYVAASAAIAGMVFVAAGRAGQVEVAAQAGAGSAGPRATVEGVAGTTTADVTIRHRRVTADGGPSGPVMPPVSMKLERRRYSGRWRTTLTLHEAAKPMVRTAGGLVALDNPFLVSRLEFDEGEGDARMYDRAGRRLARPTDTERQRFGVTPAQRGAGWDPRIFAPAAPGAAGSPVGLLRAGGFLAESRLIGTRRAELQRRFGPATGRVRGLDRFLSVDGLDTHEVLVSPAAALPVEVNTLRDGTLRARTELRYEVHGTIGHVRQFMRNEQTVADQSSGRVITEVELTNVAIATGGAQ